MDFLPFTRKSTTFMLSYSSLFVKAITEGDEADPAFFVSVNFNIAGVSIAAIE